MTGKLMIVSRRIPALLILLICATAPSQAQELAAPEEPVILTVSGNIGKTNTGDGAAAFDLAMLDALPQTEFRTGTIWTDGEIAFSGVELKTFLDALGATGETLRMTALNDYAIDMPFSDAVTGGPILATRMDGKTISVRDKGPVWVIYPFDSKPEYRTEVTYSHSIWQLKSIDVRD